MRNFHLDSIEGKRCYRGYSMGSVSHVRSTVSILRITVILLRGERYQSHNRPPLSVKRTA